jgi:hypothetical protein
MSDTNKKTDQEKGDEVLRRMLKTPPQPKEKGESQSPRPPVSHQDRKNGGNTEKA